jgi:hypothetical protein
VLGADVLLLLLLVVLLLLLLLAAGCGWSCWRCCSRLNTKPVARCCTLNS